MFTIYLFLLAFHGTMNTKYKEVESEHEGIRPWQDQPGPARWKAPCRWVHDVDMVMQSISLADTITLEEAPTLTLTIDSSALPCDERNLAYQAALVFEKWTKIKPAVHIHIQKRIYLAAGLAGGSADAAGVLRILNRYYGKPLSRGQLEEAAAEIGSDVPFCIAGGTQRALGRGELMRPLPPSPTLWMVLAKPAALGFRRQRSIAPWTA